MTVDGVRRRLVLAGAGGFARETAEAARCAGWTVAGFLDDDPLRRGERLAGARVLGPVADAARLLPGPRDRVVLCPGRGEVRARLAGRLAAAGLDPGRYGVVAHPSVDVPASCAVGSGSVLLAGVVLTADVTVGAHVSVMPGAVLTHDDVLADFVTVCARVALAGGVVVRTGAYLGAGCSVREGVTIGAGATVGMGAVVLRDVGAGEVWVGNPARRLREG